MNTESRKSGIEMIGDISWGTHISLLYNSKDDFCEILGPYIQAGLKSNELCAWIYASNISHTEILDIIGQYAENPEAIIESGQLILLPYTQWYVTDDSFNEVRVNEQWLELINTAKDKGYDGLRAIGDTFWLEKCHFRDFAHYEQNINALIPELPFIVICLYDINRIGIPDYADIIGNHSYSIIRDADEWKVIKNVELLIRSAQLENSRENFDLLMKEKNKTKESLEEAQHLAHIGSWDMDLICDEIYWSDELYRIFGLDPQSFMPQKDQFLDFVHPEDRKKFREAIHTALTQGLPYKVTFRIVRPDGSIRHAYTKSRIDLENGRPMRMYGTVQDITKRKQAEEETNRHLEFERTVLHLARDFINCPTDRMDSVILQSMEMICKHYNADRATVYSYDWAQKTVSRQYKWTSNPQRFDDSQEVFSIDGIRDVMECHEKGIPYWSVHIGDVSINSPYRETAVKSNTQSVVSIPLMCDGKAMGAFTISSSVEQAKWQGMNVATLDIFAQMLVAVLNRRDREKALQEISECNRLMLDSTNDGIALYDREGRILNINDAFTQRYGLDKEAVIGVHAKDLLPEERYADLRARRKRYLGEVFDTGKPVRFEDTKDGKTYDNRFYPIFENGKVCAVNLFSTDITDRKWAEEEARAKSEYEARLKITTDFFTNVSHELKTPLSVILIQLELVRLYMDDDQKMLELIGAATQNSYRLTRLVGNLLDITRIDSGFMRVSLTNADIVRLLRDVCESVGHYAEAKSIELRFESQAPCKTMPVDADKIERIVLNLLSNAIKHTPPEGRITVSFKDHTDRISISVQDTGEGIPLEKQAAIFDRFAQVDTSLTRKNEGSGIGLALTRSFVELLGGRILVQSEPGDGSTFFIELPVMQEESLVQGITMEGYGLKRKVEMELSDLYLENV